MAELGSAIAELQQQLKARMDIKADIEKSGTAYFTCGKCKAPVKELYQKPDDPTWMSLQGSVCKSCFKHNSWE
jgi:TfoX/Sxy family transcriptional regulator of competence genes